MHNPKRKKIMRDKKICEFQEIVRGSNLFWTTRDSYRFVSKDYEWTIWISGFGMISWAKLYSHSDMPDQKLPYYPLEESFPKRWYTMRKNNKLSDVFDLLPQEIQTLILFNKVFH